jgi:hypothetical protein
MIFVLSINCGACADGARKVALPEGFEFLSNPFGLVRP